MFKVEDVVEVVMNGMYRTGTVGLTGHITAVIEDDIEILYMVDFPEIYEVEKNFDLFRADDLKFIYRPNYEMPEIKAGYLIEVTNDINSTYLMIVNYNNEDVLGAYSEPYCRNVSDIIQNDEIIRIYGRANNLGLNNITTCDRDLIWERTIY